MKLIQNIKARWKAMSLGVLIGAVLGYGFYAFIGCRTGTCGITSDPLNSTAYGALVGLLWAFPSDKREKN